MRSKERCERRSHLCPTEPWYQVTPDWPACQAFVHCCTLSHYLSSSWRMQKEGCLSPSVHSLCVYASFPLPLCPASHRAHSLEKWWVEMWAFVGRKPHWLMGSKTGTRWNHSRQLSPVQDFFHSRRNVQWPRWCEFQWSLQEWGGTTWHLMILFLELFFFFNQIQTVLQEG